MIQIEVSRLLNGSFFYGIGSVLQRFIGIFLLPFYTRELQPSDYGAMALILMVQLALSGLFSLGTGNSMGLLYFKESKPEKRTGILWTNFFLLLFNGSFWFVMMLFFSPLLSELVFQSTAYVKFLNIIFLSMVFGNLSEVWLAYLRMEERSKIYVLLTLLTSILTIGFSAILVLYFQLGLYGLILATLAGQILSLLFCLIFVASKVPFQLDLVKVWPLVRLGFPSIFGMFAFLLIDYSDRQMIERLLDLNALGVYSIGYNFGMVITIGVGAFTSAWPPFFMSYYHRREEAKLVFGKVLSYYVLIFGSLSVLFFVFAKLVVVGLTAPEFSIASKVIGLISASYVVKGCYLIMLPGLSFAEKLGTQTLIEWVAAIVNLVLNYFLIPYFGLVGAALATFFSYLILPMVTWLVARNYLEVDYEWGRIAVLVFLLLLVSLSVYNISEYVEIDLLQSLLFNCLMLLIYVLVVFRFVLTRNERNFIIRKLNP
jgi:O-antigen/teichoic acid export membrane protein